MAITTPEQDAPAQDRDPGELLLVAEVASRLRVSDETVRVWLRRGIIHGFKLGAKSQQDLWRIPVSEVERMGF